MQANIDAIHQFLDIATPIVGLFVAFVGLKLSNGILQAKLDSQADAAKMKADLVQAVTSAKQELVAHNTRVASDLRAHEASDATTFDWIKEALRRIEKNGAAPKS